MANSKQLFRELAGKIKLNESKEEIESIVYLILEDRFGYSRSELLQGIELRLTGDERFPEIIERINRHEPIQYVLGESEFYGRKFSVTPAVLIPRPETELLIREVLQWQLTKPNILDVGTGSGCIAITLSLESQESNVFALDVSADALNVAEHNASRLGARVNFRADDILNPSVTFSDMDVIASNPPYVLAGEKSNMQQNVLGYEPALALFVPDDDPLRFYKAIAKQATSWLKPKGRLIVEINERMGEQVSTLFNQHGFVEIRRIKDLDNKDRFVVGTWGEMK